MCQFRDVVIDFVDFSWELQFGQLFFALASKFVIRMLSMARKFIKLSSARALLINGKSYEESIYTKNSGTLLDVLKNFFILTILLVCLKRKPAQIVVKSSLNGLVIGPELVMIPEKHCFLWTATRDFNQRKFNYPTSYRYGLSLRTNCNLSHIFLLILLSDDVATNPGPHSFVKKKKNSVSNNKINCSVLNARSPKSFHREEISNRTVCNLERFQNFVYNENSDIVCVQ